MFLFWTDDGCLLQKKGEIESRKVSNQCINIFISNEASESGTRQMREALTVS